MNPFRLWLQAHLRPWRRLARAREQTRGIQVWTCGGMPDWPARLLVRAGAWGFAALILSQVAQAQWRVETLDLKAGWNAVFLHVDASYATLDELVGAQAPELTPITEVWRWNPNPATDQFLTSPQQPVDTGSQWTSWKRVEPDTSNLQRLTANTAYLVFTTADFTWHLTGQPVLPSYSWTTAGENLVGFSTVPTTPPDFQAFLSPAQALLDGEIFRYPGGDLGPNNPILVTALRTTPVRRGEAFWIRAGDTYNDFFGPFEVTGGGSGQVKFGDSLSAYSFRLRNRTGSPLTVSLAVVPSAPVPAGQPAIAGVPPLLLRGSLNTTNLTYGFDALPANTPHSWVLEPQGQLGSEVEVVLGLDRSSLTGPPGSSRAGVLVLTDSLGQSSVELGVSATVASQAGLWVGAAAITQVAQYLKSYLKDADNQLVVQSNGAYVVTSVVTNLTPVPTSFPLKLIVHNPASGRATLLQRVYFGFDVATNPIVANQESALDPGRIADSRRISASHLPWMENNPGWSFSGPLILGAVLKTSVTNRFDDQRSNPFLHTYHPDHDNLDSRFASELPQGAESYTIVRDVSLSIKLPPNDFNSRVNAGITMVGDYLETLRVQGLARSAGAVDTRRFDVRGSFKMTRITDIPTLTRVP